MRCLMIVKGTADSEAGRMPSLELVQAMGAFNQEMQKAGVMIDGTGLKPSSKAARVQFDAKGTPTVIDGPFAETKELISGFWVIEVTSLDEAISWAKRIPQLNGQGPSNIEIRPYFEAEDFAYLGEAASA
jgi:hypothetical protein